jgi:hypothetical protein
MRGSQLECLAAAGRPRERRVAMGALRNGRFETLPRGAAAPGARDRYPPTRSPQG